MYACVHVFAPGRTTPPTCIHDVIDMGELICNGLLPKNGNKLHQPPSAHSFSSSFCVGFRLFFLFFFCIVVEHIYSPSSLPVFLVCYFLFFFRLCCLCIPGLHRRAGMSMIMGERERMPAGPLGIATGSGMRVSVQFRVVLVRFRLPLSSCFTFMALLYFTSLGLGCRTRDGWGSVVCTG